MRLRPTQNGSAERSGGVIKTNFLASRGVLRPMKYLETILLQDAVISQSILFLLIESSFERLLSFLHRFERPKRILSIFFVTPPRRHSESARKK
jgi:hypothetical protein